MSKQPTDGFEASALKGASLHDFARSLEPLGLPHGGAAALFLRFEPMGRLQPLQVAAPKTVGVLVTWRTRSLSTGAIDHVRALSWEHAQALLAACRACSLPVVNNLCASRRATAASV